MTHFSVQNPRVTAVPPPHEPWVEHAAGPPPAPPPPHPAPADHGTVDLARQFQQVMLRFLQTQEVVMHDLLVFLGSQSGAVAPSPRLLRAPGVESNGYAMPTPVVPPAALAPHAIVEAWDGTTIAPEPVPPPVVAPAPARRDDVDILVRPPRVAPPEEPRHPVARETNGPPPEPAARPPQDRPPAAAIPTRQQLTERLLAIVGERTGYPEEMLALDADLEADLGIDSIKRVEIAGTVIQSLSLPEGLTPDIEKVTGSRSLRQVIDNLEMLVNPGGAGGPDGAGSATSRGQRLPFDDARTGPGVGRFALQPAAAPPLGAPAGLPRAGVLVIVDDEVGVGRRLSVLLGQEGYRAVRVVAADGETAGEAGVLAADFRRPDEAVRLADELHERHGPAAALIHLSALRPEQDRAAREPGVGLTVLFQMAQVLGPDLETAAANGGGAVLAATAMGGSFGVNPSDSFASPGQGGLVGFLKALAQEWPSVRVKAVDLPSAGPESVADWLRAELFAADGLVEVGYRDGRRTVLELAAAPLPTADGGPGLPIDGDSVILVTGGARGITARAALSLAEAARPTLLLVGRTPLLDGPEPAETVGLDEPRALRRAIMEQLRSSGQPATPGAVEERYRRLLQAREVRGNLGRLRRAGSRVDYVACDVRDPEAFGSLIDDAYRRYGRIDGVIHGAGIIEDKLVRDKALESFERVVETKVNGALVLAARLRPESLRFLILFGSIAGRFGNRGQADYAAASEVLNKLAHDLDRRWPARVASINWGPWLESSMVPAGVERQFAERGVVLIPPDVGCRMLIDELKLGRKGEVEVLIGGALGPQAHVVPAGPPPASQFATGRDQRASLPPLLAAAGVLSQGEGAVQVTRRLSPDVDLYLQDHRLDGQPVLPFAMAMELMAEAAAAGWPGRDVVEVREIQLLRGVIIDGDAREVWITAQPREASVATADGSPSPVTADVSITHAGNPRLVHYRAVVELGRAGMPKGDSDPTGWPGTVGVLDGAGPMPMSVAETYRDWLFHGPLFQGITSIDAIGPGGARAVLRPSGPRDCLRGEPAGDWLIDPVLVDSALQMQVVWARLHWDVTLLPARIHRYRALGSLRDVAGCIRYELWVRPESQMPTCLADHFFFSPDGRLLAVLTGVEGTGSKALNRLAGGRGAGDAEIRSVRSGPAGSLRGNS